jgi:hypothetical protein
MKMFDLTKHRVNVWKITENGPLFDKTVIVHG